MAASEGALRPTPATIGSVTGLPARTGQRPGSLTRPPRDVSLEYIRWRHVGFGLARAVAAVTNVLNGAFPLGGAGSPAQQFVALSPGRPIAPAWTSSTTIWFPAPASVSPTPARSVMASFGPSPLEDRSESGCVGLG